VWRRALIRRHAMTPRRPLMRRQFLALTAAALALPVVLSGCSGVSPKHYRFKMTIEVETPQGLKTGSSVYEVSASENKARLLPEEHALSWGVKGEAVAVDVAPSQTLFALLKTGAMHGDMASLSMQALDPAFNNDIVESAARIAARQGVQSFAVVDPKLYPQLVHFGDVRDPKSVAAVDPAHLDAAFGPGVTLKRITVQVTDEPVTTGIEKRLGWLGAYPEPSLNPNHGPTDYSISATLHHGDFRQGVN
jgi:hypothetical protein